MREFLKRRIFGDIILVFDRFENPMVWESHVMAIASVLFYTFEFLDCAFPIEIEVDLGEAGGSKRSHEQNFRP